MKVRPAGCALIVALVAEAASAQQRPGETPMDRARACLRSNAGNMAVANQCVVLVLRGHASTTPELGLLCTVYRSMGHAPEATRCMRTYLQRFPAGPQAASFRLYLDGANSHPTAAPSTALPLQPRGLSGPVVMHRQASGAGVLSQTVIRGVVQTHRAQISRCHERGLSASRTASGRVVVRFVVEGNGTVSASTVTEDTIGVPIIGECIADAVRGWQFPPPSGGGAATVDYPFNLRPSE